MTDAASATAATMREYVPHRQTLRSSARTLAAASGAAFD
jgi:hypothetical protein